MKKVRLLSALFALVLVCSLLPVTAHAIETKTVIEIDGSKMTGETGFNIPDVEDGAFYIHESKWYELQAEGMEVDCSNKREPGKWYLYRLILIPNDPNAYANDCIIIIKGVDWREANPAEEIIGGKRALVFEGMYHAHKGKHIRGKEPTCTESGMQGYFLCDCGLHSLDELGYYPINDAAELYLESFGHERELMYYIDPVEATCEEDGVIVHWHCPRCNKDFDFYEEGKDITGKTAIPAAGHKDENKDGKCDVCGKASGIAEPTEPVKPTEPTVPAAPTEPTVPTVPTEPTPTEPTGNAPTAPGAEKPGTDGFTVGTVIAIAAAALVIGAGSAVGVTFLLKKKQK